MIQDTEQPTVPLDAGRESETARAGTAIEKDSMFSELSPMVPAVEGPSRLHQVFFGPEGLRAGWGLLAFLLILILLSNITNSIHHKLNPKPVMTAQQRAAEAAAPQIPGKIITVEGISFAMVLVATWIMSRLERRPMGAYGFGGRRKLAPFVSGFAWGCLFLAALIATLRISGLLAFDGRLLFGATALRYGAIWLLVFVLVGLLEEYLLRGYLQYTLARGLTAIYRLALPTRHDEALGFWTAALLLSFVFGLGHTSNPGESPIGLLSAGLIGIVFCLTLWQTGSLWWALGFHAAWDWAQSFVFGVADSGTTIQGHLLATHPMGSVLLSGGATGPEGSIFILPTLAAIAGVATWTLPKRRAAELSRGEAPVVKAKAAYKLSVGHAVLRPNPRSRCARGKPRS